MKMPTIQPRKTVKPLTNWYKIWHCSSCWRAKLCCKISCKSVHWSFWANR